MILDAPNSDVSTIRRLGASLNFPLLPQRLIDLLQARSRAMTIIQTDPVLNALVGEERLANSQLFKQAPDFISDPTILAQYVSMRLPYDLYTHATNPRTGDIAYFLSSTFYPEDGVDSVYKRAINTVQTHRTWQQGMPYEVIGLELNRPDRLTVYDQFLDRLRYLSGQASKEEPVTKDELTDYFDRLVGFFGRNGHLVND